MTEAHEELLRFADHLDRLSERGDDAAIRVPLERLAQSAKEIGKAWSGSWLGYHSKVYYANLEPPPPGAHFSQEWGLEDALSGSRGDWRQFDEEVVEAAVHKRAGCPDLGPSREFNDKATREFDTHKMAVLSVLEIEIGDSSDPFLTRLRDEVNGLTTLSKKEVVGHLSPKFPVMTRDYIAAGQRAEVPPHISVLSEVLAIQHTLGIVQNLSKFARQAGSHLARQRLRQQKKEIIGTNVFVGHGRSLIWRELKDFMEDRLKMPVDEFNRIPVAGVANIARLAEMLDAAAIAFLILTGEDEQPDGQLHARMNVVHEAGLFQGRLGFTRAIVVLEEGCETFSNIAGLGQIRFPKGNIKAAFEDIRQVLEREGLLSID